MTADPHEDDEFPFRPVWLTEDDTEPPGATPVGKLAVEPDFDHPLLAPLARAQDALARLETRAAAASPPLAEGLRARMAYREAAGWLRQAHVWIHPHDLALRDNNLTSSYGAAFRAGRLEAEIPATAAQASGFEACPSDIMADQALRLARLWRRLAELHTWRPLEDAPAMQETLKSLGSSATAGELADWLACVQLLAPGPPLIRAARAARDWMNRPTVAPRSPEAIFFAACLWRDKAPCTIPLPFWSAPEPRHYRLELRVGLAWVADFLNCVAAAAKAGLDELDRLTRAEEAGRQLRRTARSRLPQALHAALRAPIVTARDLAATLKITPQAAIGLLGDLVEAGVLREATGRNSWRAFTLA